MQSQINTNSSSIPQVLKNIDTTTTTSVIQLLLAKVKQHVKNGTGDNWLTNSVSGTTIRYADIEPMTRKIASALSKLGFKVGDVAIYFTRDVTLIYCVIFGVWRCAGCMHASYVEDTPDTIARRIKQTKARWVFCDADLSPVADVARKSKGIDWNVEIFTFGDVGPRGEYKGVNQLLEDDGEDCPTLLETTPDQPLLILCTSGTTGYSKGAVHTNSTIMALLQLYLRRNLKPNPKPLLYIIKCTHVIGCLHAFMNILGGNWSLLMPELTKLNIFGAIDKYKPYFVYGYPTYSMALVTDPEAKSYDFSSVKVILTGGVVITPSMRNTLLKLPSLQTLIVGYSLTECPLLTSTIDVVATAAAQNRIVNFPNVPPGSVGKVYAGAELQILDLNTNAPLGPNQEGEIVIKSPFLCAKYYAYDVLKDTNVVASPLSDDGWFHTGDLGTYDENGFIFVVGRVKETFKFENNHVNPVELEEILLQHPAVAEAAVLGIQDPISLHHLPTGFVVLKQNSAGNTDMDIENEIKEYANVKVASYKQFRGGIHILDSLPRGSSGKIDKKAIEANFKNKATNL